MPILYILLGLLALLAILVLVAVIRTLLMKAPAPAVCENVYPQQTLDMCAEKLGALVRVPSVSKREDEDLSAFKALHAELERLFPLLHKNLEKVELNGTLLYRWVGADPSKRPVLFMGHQDVVPASDAGWTVPAYSGAVVDGKLYGRGVGDCKCNIFVEMQAVEELLFEGFVPPCDVYLEYSINEETGGDGAASAMRYLRDKGVELAVVLDEGGAVVDSVMSGIDRPFAVIGVTEKGYVDLRITARAKGGHSSTPPRNTPTARLFAFAHEIETKRPFKKIVLPEVAEMFRCMAPSFGFGMRLLLGNLWLFKPLLVAVMPRVSPFGEALLATTCCFTMMEGSDAPNVIPKEPYIVANLRTSVQQGVVDSIAVMKKYAAKYELEFEILQQRDASPVSNISSPEYAYVVACIRAQFPDVGVAPYVIMGGTDCRHFHEISKNALRFAPVRMTAEQTASCHAVDENIDVATLAEGVEFFKMFLKGYEL